MEPSPGIERHIICFLDHRLRIVGTWAAPKQTLCDFYPPS
jgi:hypothetical protein